MKAFLDTKKYGEFLKYLSIFKDIYEDVDIRDGIIRQRSNDDAVVMEMDLTSIIGAISLPIANLKEKLKDLKAFGKSDVIISTTDESYVFSNHVSELTFQNPAMEFLDNKFITEAELMSVLKINQGKIILSASISKDISDRVKTIRDSWHENNITVEFNKDTANIYVEDKSKGGDCTFLRLTPIDQKLNHTTRMIITPFVIAHSGEILFEMFDITENIIINRFTTAIGNVHFKLYTRSWLNEREKVETTTV